MSIRFLALLIFVISFCSCRKGYTIVLKTKEAEGVSTSTRVKHLGFQIGHVSKIEVDNNYVYVSAWIEKDQVIPKGSRFELSTDLFGNGTINVIYSELTRLPMKKSDTSLLSVVKEIKTPLQHQQDSVSWMIIKKLLESGARYIDSTIKNKN